MHIIHINPLPPASHPSKCPSAINHPFFSADEKEIAVTSVRHLIRRCKNVWESTIQALHRTAEQNSLIEDADGLQNIAPVKRSGFRLKTFPSSPCPESFLPISLGLMR
ncbi:hypothetical protein AMECASPLE_034590 [Ameca splendens]|uniref:Uncharacterized protein n=1 Tax=Ameca splendens TaxID=208324 RepID=A0ABV0YU94_9TELE